MIQIEYLLNALKIDVVESEFTTPQKAELNKILESCPTVPITINIFRVAKIGKEIEKQLDLFESKYLEFGGSIEHLKSIRNDYKNTIVSTLKGYKRGKIS